MADIITDTINAACKMLGINQPVKSTGECQQKIMQQRSTGVPFNVDSSTSVNRNIMGPSAGSMVYDTSFRFNTDSSTVRKVSPTLIQDYHNRIVDGTHFN